MNVLCVCFKVKKGLEHLYRKVEKHLCEEENLLQVFAFISSSLNKAGVNMELLDTVKARKLHTMVTP